MIIGVAVFAVLEGVILFIVVFSEICFGVDINEGIVLFLEKVRVEGRSGGRELCHLVVIN